jgi:hypothetical protein
MNERERAAGAAAEQERADAVDRLYAGDADWDAQAEHRELLRYTDTDGDEIVLAIDPVDDTGEDVLLVLHRYDGHSLAARLPVQTFRDVLAKLEEVWPS